MDIGVKERVIGAAVLVVLGIIIIPWVLQGPAPDSAVTRDVPLPAASTQAAPAEYRMDLSNPALSPAPLAAGRTAEPATTQHAVPAPVVPAPAAVKPQAIERAPATGKSGTVQSGGWVIQAGSYGSQVNAQRLQKTLQAHGYKVVISPHASGGKTWYRVWVGPYAARGTAEQALPAINRLYGGKARVVPNA